MADAPGEAKEDQQSDRQADRLVHVEPSGAQAGRALRQIQHPPAERDLAQHQHRDDPVQRDRHLVVAFRHSQEAFLRSNSSVPRWPPSAAMSAAVLPRLSCAETSAPRSSSGFTASVSPRRAAASISELMFIDCECAAAALNANTTAIKRTISLLRLATGTRQA